MAGPEATAPDDGARVAVSVAVMTCNQGPFLADCLESLLAQAYRPLCIQLFDNGSNDETARVVAAFRRRLPAGVAFSAHRFDYLGGPAALLNAMAPLLAGEIVVLQAGDDLALPERVGRLAALFAERPDALLAHSAAEVVDAGGRALERLDFPSPPAAAQALHYGRVQGHVLGATLAIRRRLLTDFPPLDDRAFEDAQLPFRAALAGEVAYAPERLLRYRRHGGNVTHALHSLESLAALRQARAAVLRRMEALAEIRRRDLAHFLAGHPAAGGRFAELPAAIAGSLALARDEAALWSASPLRRFAAWGRLARRRRGPRALATSALVALAPGLELRRRRRRRAAS